MDPADRNVHARRAASFGAAAAAYAQHRPDYPIAAIEWALRPVSGPAPGPIRILDLGAGTGKLTAQLTSLRIGGRSAEIIAVEPDPQMRAELARQVPGCTALAGSAEAIPLPDESVDAVLAGQAAHWFDLDRAMPEIARVLVPSGVLAGLWNVDDDRVPWVAELHRAAGQAGVRLLAMSGQHDDSITGWLGAAGRGSFGPAEQDGFSHLHRRTAESLIETISTHSVFLVTTPDQRAAALDQFRRLLAATPQTSSGEFSLPLYTLVARTIRR